MAAAKKIKIILVSDQKMLREGLRSLFQKQTDMEVIGETGSGKTAIQLAHELKPNVIIVDINPAKADGPDDIRHITGKFPGTKIIALSMYLENGFIEKMLKAGVSGYVNKGQPFFELLKAINSVTNDQTYLCPSTADVVMDGYIQTLAKTNDSSYTGLTDREEDILKLLAEGKNAKQIALELGISAKTVDTHRQHIMRKLDLHSLPELTKYAIRCGLSSLE